MNVSVRPPIPEVLAAVREVYADLAKRPIERQCVNRADCCRFRLTGRMPNLTWPEALYAARGMRAAGRKKLPAAPDGACPLLEPGTGRCTIYEHRPMGCRTHFCKAAGGPYARNEVRDLIQRLEDLGSRLGKPGASGLTSILPEALSKN